MKRILSVLCAIAVLGTMVCSVAFATNPALTATIDGASTTQVGDKFNINISYSGVEGLAKTNGNNQTAITNIEFVMTVPAGYTVDAEDGTYLEEETWVLGAAQTSGLAVSFVDGEFTYGLTPSSKATYIITGSSDLISIPIECTAAPSSDVEFTISGARIAVITMVSGKKTDEVEYINETLDVTPASISVGSSGGDEDGEVTVGSAASFATDDGTLAGSKAILGATGGEYGSAFRITFTRPEGATDNGVIFGIDLDGTKVFAPKQANLLAGVSANSAVTVDVSFLNGSTASGKAGVIEPQNITGISVILSDGAGKFFYSDSTDKAHKAPIAE